jgi:hypothetical protein
MAVQALSIISPGPLAGVIGIFGFLAVLGWVGWPFGPTLTRTVSPRQPEAIGRAATLGSHAMRHSSPSATLRARSRPSFVLIDPALAATARGQWDPEA